MAATPTASPTRCASLRRFKSEVALLVALADLGGVWPVMAVTAALTGCADAAAAAAVRFLFARPAARATGSAASADAAENGSGYIVLGMGKYGARELNYSSDIDLIVFYEPDARAACATASSRSRSSCA